MAKALYQSEIKSLPLVARGKVRDMYAVGSDKLLIVTTDRLSAFDVVLNDPIPGKGRVLTSLTNFWLNKFAHVLPNHLTHIDPCDVVKPNEHDQVKGRAMVVKRLRPILVEAVVRGYLSGSGWNDYQKTGNVCGVVLPKGLKLSEKLANPIFTPAAKAEVGEHDENISFNKMQRLIGADLSEKIRNYTLDLYNLASEYAATKGIIIADTKFEFGLDDAGQLHIMDEVLTPDSSRFWSASDYAVGSNPPSFDKQFVRDWLLTQPWDKTAPAPNLPTDIINKTSEKYQEALICLTQSNNSESQANNKPVVGVIMGSSSDWPIMEHAVNILKHFGIAYEAKVVSAHRMPLDMVEYAGQAANRGLQAIIAGAGGAAHLPGMVAALTPLPVFGVPVPSKHLQGQDSLLSIVQMPRGVPVATFSIGDAGAANAALHVIACLAVQNTNLQHKLIQYRNQQTEQARAMQLPTLPNS